MTGIFASAAVSFKRPAKLYPSVRGRSTSASTTSGTMRVASPNAESPSLTHVTSYSFPENSISTTFWIVMLLSASRILTGMEQPFKVQQNDLLVIVEPYSLDQFRVDALHFGCGSRDILQRQHLHHTVDRDAKRLVP